MTASVWLCLQVWFKNRRAKCRQQQQQSTGQAKPRPPKKKASPAQEQSAPDPVNNPAGTYSPSPAPSGPSLAPNSGNGNAAVQEIRVSCKPFMEIGRFLT